jgi:hypothetical protein
MHVSRDNIICIEDDLSGFIKCASRLDISVQMETARVDRGWTVRAQARSTLMHEYHTFLAPLLRLYTFHGINSLPATGVTRLLHKSRSDFDIVAAARRVAEKSAEIYAELFPPRA